VPTSSKHNSRLDCNKGHQEASGIPRVTQRPPTGTQLTRPASYSSGAVELACNRFASPTGRDDV